MEVSVDTHQMNQNLHVNKTNFWELGFPLVSMLSQSWVRRDFERSLGNLVFRVVAMLPISLLGPIELLSCLRRES